MNIEAIEELAALFSNRRKQTKSMRESFKKITNAAKRKLSSKKSTVAKKTATKKTAGKKVHGNTGKPKSEAHRLAISRALKKHYAGKKKAQPARTKTGKIKTDKKTLANAHSKLNAIEKRAKARKAKKEDLHGEGMKIRIAGLKRRGAHPDKIKAVEKKLKEHNERNKAIKAYKSLKRSGHMK